MRPVVSTFNEFQVDLDRQDLAEAVGARSSHSLACSNIDDVDRDAQTAIRAKDREHMVFCDV